MDIFCVFSDILFNIHVRFTFGAPSEKKIVFAFEECNFKVDRFLSLS